MNKLLWIRFLIFIVGCGTVYQGYKTNEYFYFVVAMMIFLFDLIVLSPLNSKMVRENKLKKKEIK